MNITQRRYNLLVDYPKVYNFLAETYDLKTLNSFLIPPFFENKHHHWIFDYIRAHRMGIWEHDGNIVAIVAYEFKPDSAHLHTKPEYSFLLPEMLEWAEKELYSLKDGVKTLSVCITDKEIEKQQLLKNNGYTLGEFKPIHKFQYENNFKSPKLPDGFKIINGNEMDLNKLINCFWVAFGRDGEPPSDYIDGNIRMWSAPNFDKSLLSIAAHENGDYACATAFWFDKKNKYAYLEPLATVPKYRKMGLASAVINDNIEKTRLSGAKYCLVFGASDAVSFYEKIGFEAICNKEVWSKLL
ncbi:MAG: GNAT family N-acetyltransferase [Defluviitaleaceae bacterium]|nr:GNAT family N-acetyltransferase [Defluviitaleaceae bacterium]